MLCPGQPCPASRADAFELRFTSIRRGARLARRLTSYCLHSWGHGYDSEGNQNVSLVVAELAANAVTDALLRLVREDGRRLATPGASGCPWPWRPTSLPSRTAGW
ncbi:hypothetical protein [Streptomyces sp. NBC_01615]|uniref:hypothetical protein n=1 Tax=Streptomyces sp. NBC_01615 TaxID=2975898 RepID=UPI003868118F